MFWGRLSWRCLRDMSVLRFVYDTAVSRGIMKSSAHSEHEVGYDVVALVNDSIGLDSLAWCRDGRPHTMVSVMVVGLKDTPLCDVKDLAHEIIKISTAH